MTANFDHSTLARLVAELRLAAANCPQCQGTRETVFTSRGRDNIVPCLECENIHQALEHLEAALALLKEG
jgi:uncharacterized Zn finger protein